MDNNLYDISKYTDQQLYDILDINNPTDRELEARIVHLINKYSNMQNNAGDKLSIFFQNIYNHFFDLDLENNRIEGFDNPLQIQDYVDASDNVQTEPTITENKNYKTTGQEIQSTISFDYIKDKFGLNPLLKQTIKRIICIDSQYRDNKNTTLSTDFKFYLTEPLRDVVSLKLESIQIPLTWWTINKSYGSNFFYLKGTKDGINSGNHDYKFEISPGYYSLSTTSISNNQQNIYEAINESIANVAKVYSDVNFGTTSITQSSGTTKVKIDIQNLYNELNYKVDFVNSYNDTTSIANFLGFMNSTVYEPNAIYSITNIELTNNIVINNNKYPFVLDDSNNYFHIVQYKGPNSYTNDASINSFKIQIESGTYYRDELINQINVQMKNSYFLESNQCYIERIDILDPSNIYNGYSYYKLNIRLNKYTVKPVPNSKVVVIFPDESNINRNNIAWTRQSNKISAFFFDSLYNETNTIYGETISSLSSIQINDNTNIKLLCRSPPNYTRNTTIINSDTNFELNDYQIQIPSGNYNITDFVDVLNTLFETYNFDGVVTGKAFSIDSRLKINMDIVKKFDNRDWNVRFDKSSILYTYLGINDVSNISLSNKNIFTGSFANKTLINENFIVDTSYILTFYPGSSNNGNKNDQVYDVCIPNFNISKVYSSYLLLVNDIEFSIKQFNIYNTFNNENIYPLSTSFITSRKRLNKQNKQIIDVFLNLNVEYFLSENNYEIQFNDGTTRNDIKSVENSWYNLTIDYSYNLYQKKLPFDPFGESQNYSTIITGPIILNQININSTNNQLKIMMDPSCIAYTPKNDIVITIPQKKYTKYSLISYINSVFSSDPKTYGTKFMVYAKDNFEYVKLVMNINVIYSTKDYKLVFYDPYSFIRCYAGSKTAKNTTWDSTLGWILGFRDYTEYELIESNQTLDSEKIYYLDSIQGSYKYENIYNTDLSFGIINSNIELTGDTNCTLITHTYFYIILDDYIQNHINDGLVSITKKETSIDLPTFASKSTVKTCDPTTNTPIISSTTNTDGLTSKQIYALNQSLISKRNAIKSISNNSFITDIFAMIPLKTGGTPNGSYYIETGGNLQNQERIYFGPVNIQRMSIKLVSHNGDVIDLNNTDWSFSFICEQLYRN